MCTRPRIKSRLLKRRSIQRWGFSSMLCGRFLHYFLVVASPARRVGRELARTKRAKVVRPAGPAPASAVTRSPCPRPSTAYRRTPASSITSCCLRGRRSAQDQRVSQLRRWLSFSHSVWSAQLLDHAAAPAASREPAKSGAAHDCAHEPVDYFRTKRSNHRNRCCCCGAAILGGHPRA